jgi:hypothetical protein
MFFCVQLPNRLFGALEELLDSCLAEVTPNYKSPFVALNAQYTSSTFVTEVIMAMSSMLRDQQVDRINEADYFAVMIDETTDITTSNQLSIYVRYLLNNQPAEEFLGVVHLTGTLRDS